MTTICYYISDYGYGHAARSIAVIRELMERAGEGVRMIVRSSRALPFLRDSLRGVPRTEFLPTAGDPGYCLKPGSIEPDADLLSARYRDFLAAWPEEAEREERFLRRIGADLIVTDISPIPLPAAGKLGIPSVGLSNFTWYTAYEGMLSERLLQPLYEAYSHLDYFIALPGAEEEPGWGRRGGRRADFFCREAGSREIARLRRELDDGDGRLTVFVALGMSIEVEELAAIPLWRDESCRFIVSSNMDVSRANVIRIPAGYTESQHYVAISDLVVTKPGWGTVSEAVVLNKPLVLLERGGFREDRSTVRALEGRHPCELIDWNELRAADMNRLWRELRSGGAAAAPGPVPADGRGLREICDYLDQFIS